MSDHDDFLKRVQRVDALVQTLERAADPSAAVARDLAQTIVELHGAGLARLLALLQQTGDAGRAILDRVVEDDLLRSLLMLHDLHPLDLESRVRLALESVAPLVRGYGRTLSILSVSPEAVRLAFDDASDFRSSPTAALRTTIEQAILEAAPDVQRVLFEGPAAVGPLDLPILTLSSIRA